MLDSCVSSARTRSHRAQSLISFNAIERFVMPGTVVDTHPLADPSRLSSGGTLEPFDWL